MAGQDPHMINQTLLTLSPVLYLFFQASSYTDLIILRIPSFPTHTVVLHPLLFLGSLFFSPQVNTLVHYWTNIYLNPLYPTLNQKTNSTAHIYTLFSILISTTLNGNLQQEESILLIMKISNMVIIMSFKKMIMKHEKIDVIIRNQN